MWRMATLPCRFLNLADPTLRVGRGRLADAVRSGDGRRAQRLPRAVDPAGGIDMVWIHGHLVLDHGALSAPRPFPGRTLMSPVHA